MLRQQQLNHCFPLLIRVQRLLQGVLWYTTCPRTAEQRRHLLCPQLRRYCLRIPLARRAPVPFLAVVLRREGCKQRLHLPLQRTVLCPKLRHDRATAIALRILLYSVCKRV